MSVCSQYGPQKRTSGRILKLSKCGAIVYCAKVVLVRIVKQRKEYLGPELRHDRYTIMRGKVAGKRKVGGRKFYGFVTSGSGHFTEIHLMKNCVRACVTDSLTGEYVHQKSHTFSQNLALGIFATF